MLDNVLKAIEIIMGYIIVFALLVTFILTAPILAGIIIICGMIMMIAETIRNTRETKRKVNEMENNIK